MQIGIYLQKKNVYNGYCISNKQEEKSRKKEGFPGNLV